MSKNYTTLNNKIQTPYIKPTSQKFKQNANNVPRSRSEISRNISSAFKNDKSVPLILNPKTRSKSTSQKVSNQRLESTRNCANKSSINSKFRSLDISKIEKPIRKRENDKDQKQMYRQGQNRVGNRVSEQRNNVRAISKVQNPNIVTQKLRDDNFKNKKYAKTPHHKHPTIRKLQSNNNKIMEMYSQNNKIEKNYKLKPKVPRINGYKPRKRVKC